MLNKLIEQFSTALFFNILFHNVPEIFYGTTLEQTLEQTYFLIYSHYISMLFHVP